ncbi:hypothetical protein N9N67_02960 [Bacteriovoracaceae bacterium]|nr:hypothetical protein [Bacteriovoracaceae bacterium]
MIINKFSMFFILLFTMNFSIAGIIFDKDFEGDNCLKSKPGRIRLKLRQKIEWGVYTELKKYGFKNIKVGLIWLDQMCKGRKNFVSYNIWAKGDCENDYCLSHENMKLIKVAEKEYYYKVRFSYWMNGEEKVVRDVKLGYIK